MTTDTILLFAPSCRPGLVGYAMQLALAALQRIAEPPAADGDEPMADAEAEVPAAVADAEAGGWDVGAVVAAVRGAPDGAARNQALALLAALARSHPQAALQHVMDVSFRLRSSHISMNVRHNSCKNPAHIRLCRCSIACRHTSPCVLLWHTEIVIRLQAPLALQVVAVAGSAAAAYEDVHSTAVATEALLAVLPTWLAAGRAPADAAAAVIDAALWLPFHQRLPLVSALEAALPAVRPLNRRFH